ncbi:hypothetical protein CP979_26850 [Streptomyces filamentosus]|nr:hypothetical protein CP979_26850 [Streptomyces filamentosus]
MFPASAPECGVHALGRFYASVFLEAGENIRALIQHLGHAARGSRSGRAPAHAEQRGRTRKAAEALYGQPRA